MSASRGTPIHDATVEVVAELERRAALSPPSALRALQLIARFERYATVGCDIQLLPHVTPAHVAGFVSSATRRGGHRPSVATMRMRRWAVRLLFRVARDLSLVDGDPTIDLALPGRPSATLRPLTDQEIVHCRNAALYELTSTRLSVAWALAEASARTAEIPHLRLQDLDLEHGRVWIHGSQRINARWGALSEWGVVQLQRRADELDASAVRDAQLSQISSRNGASRVALSARTIREVLTRAGLADVDCIGPGSVAGWTGARVFAATGRVDAVARAVGVRSLDTAARMIDWDWTKARHADADG